MGKINRDLKLGNKERMICTCLNQDVDRLPFWFMFGPWGETVERWKSEGLEGGDWKPPCGFDTGFMILPINLGFDPDFDWKVLKEEGEKRTVRNRQGITYIEKIGHSTIPQYIDYPVKNKVDWEAIKQERLNPDSPGRIPDNWHEYILFAKEHDAAVQIGTYPYGLFGTARDLMGVEELLVAFYDEPELIHDIMDYLTDFWIAIYKRALRDVQIDHIHIWEDMSGKQGPLISPAMFREFMMPNYKRIVEFAKQNSISIVSVDTDGNMDVLMPLVLRIPFAALYMTVDTITPLIPTKPSVQNRRIMEVANQDDSAVNLAIIDLLQARDFYIETETLLERNIAKFAVQFCLDEDVKKWADKIRADFGIDLDRQYKAPSSRQFYLYLKNRIEEQGVFIQEFIKVDIDTLRAMAIYQNKDTMPIIGINEKDRPPAKCFSLIHELVHIIKRTSSICNVMYDNTFSQNQEEVFCNAVAGELLAPAEAINSILINKSYNLNDLSDISILADKFRVSRQVIIYRLSNLGMISPINRDTMISLINDEFLSDKEEQKRLKEAGIQSPFGTNPAQKAMDKTSLSLSKAIYAGYCEDVFSKYDVAQILSIKTKHIDKYFAEVIKWDK